MQISCPRLAAALVLFAIATPAAMAGRTAPIADVIDAPIVSMSKVPGDLDTVKGTILMALIKQGWTSQVPGPGVVHAVYQRSENRIEVDITYDTKSYSIRYASSENMRYDPKKGQIHRSYNEWVRALQRSIDMEMLRARS